MRIGILALQGAFREHENILRNLGCETVQVRKKEHLDGIEGLIIPGGESTTIGKLMDEYQLIARVKEIANQNVPVFGTCAGLILMAKEIVASDQPRLDLMNIVAQRNAFGRQVDSFETDLEIKSLGEKPFRAVFIRAPYIKEAKSGVEILARVDEKAVLAQEKNMLAAAFHPELTEDPRIHLLFLEKVRKNSGKTT